jgi:adenosylmethionine-8-amino-7-oxononanoate aminotransferase
MANWNVSSLLSEDRDHLLHPLYHPDDHVQPHVWVKGKGAVLIDAEGREYIDGLACLWNVNVGHGRRELAEAAAEQMATLRTRPTTWARPTCRRSSLRAA